MKLPKLLPLVLLQPFTFAHWERSVTDRNQGGSCLTEERADQVVQNALDVFSGNLGLIDKAFTDDIVSIDPSQNGGSFEPIVTNITAFLQFINETFINPAHPLTENLVFSKDFLVFTCDVVTFRYIGLGQSVGVGSVPPGSPIRIAGIEVLYVDLKTDRSYLDYGSFDLADFLFQVGITTLTGEPLWPPK